MRSNQQLLHPNPTLPLPYPTLPYLHPTLTLPYLLIEREAHEKQLAAARIVERIRKLRLARIYQGTSTPTTPC